MLSGRARFLEKGQTTAAVFRTPPTIPLPWLDHMRNSALSFPTGLKEKAAYFSPTLMIPMAASIAMYPHVCVSSPIFQTACDIEPVRLVFPSGYTAHPKPEQRPAADTALIVSSLKRLKKTFG